MRRRECAPVDRLRECIHGAVQQEVGTSLTLCSASPPNLLRPEADHPLDRGTNPTPSLTRHCPSSGEHCFPMDTASTKITGTWSDDPAHFRRVDRRNFLTVGALAGVGSLTLADLLRSEARAEQKSYDNFEGTAKSVIHIFLPGGMAHQESFDPKPYAPIEYRGEMGQVQTKVPGVLFGDTLGRTSSVADKLCVIRSMTHGEAAHERGTHNMYTGYRPSPALQYPSMGSVVSLALRSFMA